MTRSLYETINGGFTTVMKQHFVDYFVGKALNTDVWATANIWNSAASYGIDENGLVITSPTGTATNNVYFNNKRPFDARGCAIIVTTGSQYDCETRIGLGSDGSVNDIPEHMVIMNSYSGWSSDKSEPAALVLQVQDAPSYVTLKLGIPSALEFRNYKIEGKSSSVEGTVNGILAGTITATVIAANTKLEPVLRQKHTYTPPSIARKTWFKYCEAYNT